MFYFIPSWYSLKKKWSDPTTVFFRESINREFDDTIHQVRIFNKSKENISIIFLNYFPNFRYFSNRQKITDIPYISIFDKLQNTENVISRIIKIEDIIIDKNVEYIYTPFLLMIYKNNEIYAKVNYADEGYIISIIIYNDSNKEKKYIFDDRGFISSVVYYDNNIEFSQEYLNINGVWQFKHFFETDNVEINDFADINFKKKNYNSLDELIQEKLVELVQDNSVIVFSGDETHNNIVINSNNSCKYVCSIFENRLDLLKLNENFINKVDLFVVDNNSNVKLLNEFEINNGNILQITPYDTRLQLGKSQRKKELIIYLVADGNSENRLKKILVSIFEIMINEKNIELVIGTFNKNYSKVYLTNIINSIFDEFFDSQYHFKDKDNDSENNIDDFEKLTTELPISINVINNELDLIKALEYVRLILNLSEDPNILTSIAGISSGIPQINVVKNDYVDNYKNGLIIDDLANLKYAINFYFSSLDNWNKSLVFSVEKILKYTSSEIVNEWKNRLKE